MRPDTPEALAERIHYRDVVLPTIDRERAERFPEGITSENFRAVTDWQNARIRELQAPWFVKTPRGES
jgi:hypothetical protein